MSATHASSWRSLLAFAPGIAVVVIGLAVVQGTTELAMSRNVYLVLAPLAAFGWLAAWSMARVSDRSIVSIADAQPGAVALRGTVRPFPGQSPLKAPDGSACLWYEAWSKKRQTISTRRQLGVASSDSVAPFLLVDGSGRCIVLPTGAEFSGGHDGSTSLTNGTYIADGDTLFVAGLLQAPSIDGVQATQAALEAAARQPRIGIVSADEIRQSPSHSEALTDVSLVSTIPVPALPLVHAGGGPFTIVAKGGESESSWYGLMKIVDLVVLLASLAMCAWLTLRAGSV